MSKVVVTGASGTVGRWCAEGLRARGHDVVAVGRHGPAAVDLLDEVAVERLLDDVRPDGLVHLAWETRHGHFWEAPENERWLAASTALAAAFVERGGRRLVVAGTCAEYDWSPEGLGDGTCHERTTPVGPSTAYGRAKAALLKHLVDRYGLQVGWGRIFSIYGPGEAPGRLVPSVARALLRGEPAEVTAGEQVRDYLHARDVGHGFAALWDSTVTGPVNVASGRGVRVADVVRMVAEAAGRPDLLRLGALPTRATEPPRLVADVGRLVDEVGFTPSTSLEAGIVDLVDGLRAH